MQKESDIAKTYIDHSNVTFSDEIFITYVKNLSTNEKNSKFLVFYNFCRRTSEIIIKTEKSVLYTVKRSKDTKFLFVFFKKDGFFKKISLYNNDPDKVYNMQDNIGQKQRKIFFFLFSFKKKHKKKIFLL